MGKDAQGRPNYTDTPATIPAQKIGIASASTDPATVHRIRERLRRGEGFTEEILNYRKDGGEYWAAIEVQPIPDEQGGIAHYMSIESDVTARRAEQQRLAVQFEVATVLAQAVDLSAAIHRVLRVICEHLGGRWGSFGRWRTIACGCSIRGMRRRPTSGTSSLPAAPCASATAREIRGRV